MCNDDLASIVDSGCGASLLLSRPNLASQKICCLGEAQPQSSGVGSPAALPPPFYRHSILSHLAPHTWQFHSLCTPPHWWTSRITRIRVTSILPSRPASTHRLNISLRVTIVEGITLAAMDTSASGLDVQLGAAGIALPLKPGLCPADVHVLVVDDEHLSRTVAASLLRKCNYRGACGGKNTCLPAPVGGRASPTAAHSPLSLPPCSHHRRQRRGGAGAAAVPAPWDLQPGAHGAFAFLSGLR